MTEQRGRFARALRRLTSSDEELHAEEMRGRTAERGCISVSACLDREPASVHGTLRTVTLRPRAGVPALEAELWDGSGTVTLIWLGRRRITGIEPGRELIATGRVAIVDERAQLFNPRYELIPVAAS